MQLFQTIDAATVNIQFSSLVILFWSQGTMTTTETRVLKGGRGRGGDCGRECKWQCK